MGCSAVTVVDLPMKSKYFGLRPSIQSILECLADVLVGKCWLGDRPVLGDGAAVKHAASPNPHSSPTPYLPHVSGFRC